MVQLSEGGSSSSIFDTIKYESEKFQIPTWITSSIIEVETNFDPNRVGDKGTSFGLLQLHQGGGQGDGHSIAELKDPVNNLEIGLPHIQKAYKDGVKKGLTGQSLLDYVALNSGHPAEDGKSWTTGYQEALHKAFKNGDELGGGFEEADPSKWLTGDTKGVNSTLLGRLAKLAQDNNKKINIESGLRSTEEQKKLYDGYINHKPGYNKAAKPGTSNHEKGLAVDVSDSWVKDLSESQMNQYGLTKPVKGENWHIETTMGTEFVNGLSGLASKSGNFFSKFFSSENRNGTASDDPSSVFTLFKQIDEMSSYQQGQWNDTLNPFEFIAVNVKPTATRGLIIFMGVIFLIAGVFMVRGTVTKEIILPSEDGGEE
jgi:hypothetical protein